MKAVNNANGAQRNCEVGFVWQEIQPPGTGDWSGRVHNQATLRISAGDLTVVKLDGVTAITLRAGEVIVINSGSGKANDGKTGVFVEVTSADVAIQIAKETDLGRHQP